MVETDEDVVICSLCGHSIEDIGQAVIWRDPDGLVCCAHDACTEGFGDE